ncbi:MAG: T9SS type A sorting domain-containing protein [Bacteroidia bacterium]|nr:T9SS type A sorting domain-containing protein [Bacteroidia bacterium]
MYLYDIPNGTYQQVADLLPTAGYIKGGATTTEFLASICPQQVLTEVNCVTGINDQIEESFKIFPNPATNMIKIEVAEPVLINIFDTFGNTVFRAEMTEPEEIDISNFTNGVYFVHAILGPSSFSKVLLKVSP